MTKSRSCAAAIGMVAVLSGGPTMRAAGPELTAQDRADIEQLVAGYAKALGTCQAEDYANLFAPDGGYFFSTIRGEVATHAALVAMVQSERQCNPNPNAPARGAATNASPAPRPVPAVTIESTADGAKGVASLGNAGSYEDLYVKTSKGWRFKGRSVITPPEANAKLSAEDFANLRRLAGNDQKQFDDVWVDTPNGRRFRSSGVTFSLVPDGVKGTAVLRGDGGHYEDLYVRGASGWRFKSRTYVAAAEAAKP
jgi:hypothetical protein